MNKTVISVEGLSKQYRLGMVGAGTLREDLKCGYAVSFKHVIDKSKTIYTERDILCFQFIEHVRDNKINWFGKTTDLLVQRLKNHSILGQS